MDKKISQVQILKHHDSFVCQFYLCLLTTSGYAAAAWLEGIPQLLSLPVCIASSFGMFLSGRKLKAVASLKSRISQINFPQTSADSFINYLEKEGKDGALYMGKGGSWESSQCQEASDFLKCDASSLQRKFIKRRMILKSLKNFRKWIFHPVKSLFTLRKDLSFLIQASGQQWISALLPEENAIWQKASHRAGHMLIVGGAGAGKTQTMIIFIIQDIWVSRAVLIIDPKGDNDIRNAVYFSYKKRSGDTKGIFEFDLAYPERSIHLDLFSNCSRPTEIATKICDCLPKETANSEFSKMGESFLKTVCQGISIANKPLTFKRIYYYINNREKLLVDCLEGYLKEVLGKERFKDLCTDIRIHKKDKMEAYLKAYREFDRNDDVESVIKFADYDEEFIYKRAIMVFQIVEKLATGDIGKLLDPEDASANRTLSLRDIVDNQWVLLVSLHAMKDPDLSRIVGSLILSDLTALAGSRYAYGKGQLSKVALYVDEASEVLSEPFIQLLNKGRGAGFLICLATQTVSDFIARTRNKAEADKVLGNLNNLLCMRSNDGETHRYFAERITKSTVKSRMVSHAVMASADSFYSQRGTLSESVSETESELVPPEILSSLPNGECFAVISGGHVVKARMPYVSFPDWETTK